MSEKSGDTGAGIEVLANLIWYLERNNDPPSSKLPYIDTGDGIG
jgi:hypothetical protein